MKFIFPIIGKSVELTATHTGIVIKEAYQSTTSSTKGNTGIEAEQAVKALVEEEKAVTLTRGLYQKDIDAIGEIHKEYLEC